MSAKFAQILIKENFKKINLIKNKKNCKNSEKCLKKVNWTTDKKKRFNNFKYNWKT